VEWFPASSASAIAPVRELHTTARADWQDRQTPSAVITYGPHDAAELCVAVAEAGLQPGTDVIFGTFGEGPVTGDRRAVSMRVPSEQLAEKAIRMLSRKIASPDQSVPAQAELLDFDDRWLREPETNF
jgi:DNA-binding LacI/PurR family transcriptional regulator